MKKHTTIKTILFHLDFCQKAHYYRTLYFRLIRILENSNAEMTAGLKFIFYVFEN